VKHRVLHLFYRRVPPGRQSTRLGRAVRRLWVLRPCARSSLQRRGTDCGTFPSHVADHSDQALSSPHANLLRTAYVTRLRLLEGAQEPPSSVIQLEVGDADAATDDMP